MFKRILYIIAATICVLLPIFSPTITADAASNKKLAATTLANDENVSATLIEFAKKQIGKPYVFGSSGANSFDCSGFIYYVFKNNDYSVSRESTAGHWKAIEKTKKPKIGDVVFFEGTYISGPSHMGIYLGDQKFIHANSGKGAVTIDSLDNVYYKNHFLGFGRF